MDQCIANPAAAPFEHFALGRVLMDEGAVGGVIANAREHSCNPGALMLKACSDRKSSARRTRSRIHGCFGRLENHSRVSPVSNHVPTFMIREPAYAITRRYVMPIAHDSVPFVVT